MTPPFRVGRMLGAAALILCLAVPPRPALAREDGVPATAERRRKPEPARKATDKAEKTPSTDGITGAPGPFGERLTIDSKGITLAFPDDAAKLRIGGRLQIDGGTAAIRPGGGAFEAVAVRRSWIESYLTIQDALEFAFQYDFADRMQPINDAAVGYRGFKPFAITVGNIKEPFSLDQLYSDNNTLFTERSLADAFAPMRNVGALVGTHGERWTLAAGVFGGNINGDVGRQGLAATGRATFAPILKDDETLHLGLAASRRTFERDAMPPGFSARPETFLFPESRLLADTGDLADAASVGRLGLEAAYRHGPFLVQAEYIRTEVERRDGRPTLSFQGGYVQASLVLNGKGRRYRLTPPYSSEYAVFQGVQVEESDRVSRGGFGVFELAARYSAIDLADRDLDGGIERNVTLGLNWYPDKNIRFVADYVRARAEPSARAAPTEADIFVGRVQLYW